MKEFDEIYCDRCMCLDEHCRLIENARVWIRIHAIGRRLFEEVVMEYHGAFRPFMMAWVELAIQSTTAS